ncbi:hypothetical protein ACPBEH_02695 [Latilactobacillus sp. 5-91]|uniref:hypothetical protein n=1 Tax=Latilactobacillus sp. 5-91 TaxID=3410924 RepID=UPI003C7300C4
MPATAMYLKLLQEQSALLKEQADIYRKLLLEYSQRERYAAISQLSSNPKYKVSSLCKILGVSRSGYYDWNKKRSKPFMLG